MKKLILKGLNREIEKIFYSYIKVRSDTFTKYERNIEPFLMNFFSNINYFKAHPDYFGTYKIDNDPLDRSVCWSLIKGKGEDTVLLVHHNDVVDVEDFKNLKPFAYSPKELNAELMKIKNNLPDEAKIDLENGKYIFGRGSADMKAGGAIQLALIKYYSKIKNFKGNILLISVPDEENLSSGMRSAVLLLEELKEKYNLNYLIMINSEPHQRINKDVGIISEGSVGKMMAFVYVRGSLSHIGKIFEGFNPVSLLTEIVNRIELNLNFSDFIEGEASPPPTCLYIKDRKYHYDASMPLSIGGSFSILTLNRQPVTILENIKEICVESFTELILKMNEKYKIFRGRINKPFEPLPWKVKVVTFKELYDEAFNKYGEIFRIDYHKLLEKIKGKIQRGEISIIESNFLIVETILNYIKDLSPLIVLGLSPPYYPNVSNIYFENLSNKVKNLSEELIAYSERNFNQTYAREYFYTGISDLSYTSIKDSKFITESLKANMPLFESVYSIPLEKIEKLSMPCINIGPWGKDFHKFTERVLKEDLFCRIPRILNQAISILLDWQEK